MEEVRVRYVPNGAAFSEIGVSPERNASDAPSSSDGPRPLVFVETDGHESSRTDMSRTGRGLELVLRSLSIILLCVLLRVLSLRNFDDNGLIALDAAIIGIGIGTKQ